MYLYIAKNSNTYVHVYIGDQKTHMSDITNWFCISLFF